MTLITVTCLRLLANVKEMNGHYCFEILLFPDFNFLESRYGMIANEITICQSFNKLDVSMAYKH